MVEAALGVIGLISSSSESIVDICKELICLGSSIGGTDLQG